MPLPVVKARTSTLVYAKFSKIAEATLFGLPLYVLCDYQAREWAVDRQAVV